MKFCFEHLSATGGFRFERFGFVSDFEICASDLVAAKGRAVASVAKNLSAKNIKLCKTNPISKMLKIF